MRTIWKSFRNRRAGQTIFDKYRRLKLACLRGHGHGYLIAYNFEIYLIHKLGYNRVSFSRHNS